MLTNVSGRAAVSDGTKAASALAAVTGKVIFVQHVYVAITTASSGGTGIVTLRDGVAGTVLWQASAAATNTWNIDLSENPDWGYPLTSGNALSLEVSGATTDATGFAIAIGIAQ
jgi:hypothetical protein